MDRKMISPAVSIFIGRILFSPAVSIFALVILFPIWLTMPESSRWIVWNVGQGEWVTRVTETRCYHFDMGGEHYPREQIRATCAGKLNLAYFSHWDMDHIGFARAARGLFPRLCLAALPIGEGGRKKEKMFEGWPECGRDSSVSIWKPELRDSHKKKSANELCQIFVTDRMLITGDAPKKEEEVFVQDQKISDVRVLVLGHHGSRTSTSESLMRALPHLSMAIATARKAKYGHPHFEVLARLADHHVAVLKTEEWGSIEIEK
jgi:competence protein ComEC